MATWDDLATAAPELEETARRLLTRSGIGEGLLATVRGDAPPRINPVYAEVVDGRLLTFAIATSAKAADLALDGRFALHTHIAPAAPDEFSVRGHVHEVTDPELRAHALAAWAFDAADGYRLFELDIEHALLGRRPTADDWPPVYSAWRASDGG
jgi:pyridoxamine 5'-phosphate oxidase-like protein